MKSLFGSTRQRTLGAIVSVAAIAGCRSRPAEIAADSTRNLQLVNGDSSYRLDDRANPPTPRPAAVAPRSRDRSLGAGAEIEATTARTISSRHDKAGQSMTATVTNDVKDRQGRVVVPAGSILNITITELQPANDRGKADGRITLLINSVTVNGRTYQLAAGITSMVHTLKGRGVGPAEVEKTAAGVVVGGIAGRVIGGNTKGTVIGAVVGGAAGAAVAVQTANRDVVVAAGTPIVVTLTGPVTIAVQ